MRHYLFRPNTGSCKIGRPGKRRWPWRDSERSSKQPPTDDNSLPPPNSAFVLTCEHAGLFRLKRQLRYQCYEGGTVIVLQFAVCRVSRLVLAVLELVPTAADCRYVYLCCSHHQTELQEIKHERDAHLEETIDRLEQEVRRAVPRRARPKEPSPNSD